MNESLTMRDEVVAFCAAAGKDPLLVQGAGGNVSWKDGDTLWIKASGTWLADAAEKDIFVPVDLPGLRTALAAGDYASTPAVRGESTLRPSIETVLHALMPHPVVVHVHAIEVLACLVRADCLDDLRNRLGASPPWVMVPYRKPGDQLARAVGEALATHDASIVFLQNHGVVIGAASPSEVTTILEALVETLRSTPVAVQPSRIPPAAFQIGQTTYLPLADAEVHQLATNPGLFARLPSQWALYPDHVVFLGAHANVFDDVASLEQELGQLKTAPDLVFVRDLGVYALPGFSVAKQVQLRCYLDVLVRQGESPVRSLTDMDIGELLNWDAEQYRMSLSKQ